MNDIKALILAALNESIQDGMLVENIDHLASDIEQRVTEGIRQNITEQQQSESAGHVTKLDVYQSLAARTINSELTEKEYLCLFTIGINGEQGEIAEPIKKFCFHGKPLPDRDYFAHEIGDCLWYLAGLARHFKLTLSDCATANIRKLEQRHAEKIKGVKPQLVVSAGAVGSGGSGVPVSAAVAAGIIPQPTISPAVAAAAGVAIPGARQPGQRKGNGNSPRDRQRSDYADKVRSRIAEAGNSGGNVGKDGFMDDEG